MFRTPVPTPVVFERTETQRNQWAYHTVVVDLREAAPLDEGDLNDLGQDGWLLAGLFEDSRHSRLHYHFVRPA
jgi:hypothetical protein